MSDYTALVTRARDLMDPVKDLAVTLRARLDEDGTIHPFPTGPFPADLATVAFTDGAVAAEQTDALAWIAACGVCQVTGTPDQVTRANAVTPVCGDVERVRSALMACCEVRAAVTALAGPETVPELVFMDGGLATPLVSIAQGLVIRDPDASAAVTAHYGAFDAPGAITAYVDAILAEQVAALPKQDTATGYVELWARRYKGALTDAERDGLLRLRDRPVLGGLLNSGEWITPRPAKELRNVEAKITTRDGGTVPAAIDADYERLRDGLGNLYVLYFQPRQLASRVIKVEYAETDPTTWSGAGRIIRYLDQVTIGPRVKEPLGQHLVDTAAKRTVTSMMAEMMGHAAGALDPAATDHYRTAR